MVRIIPPAFIGSWLRNRRLARVRRNAQGALSSGPITITEVRSILDDADAPTGESVEDKVSHVFYWPRQLKRREIQAMTDKNGPYKRFRYLGVHLEAINGNFINPPVRWGWFGVLMLSAIAAGMAFGYWFGG